MMAHWLLVLRMCMHSCTMIVASLDVGTVMVDAVMDGIARSLQVHAHTIDGLLNVPRIDLNACT